MEIKIMCASVCTGCMHNIKAGRREIYILAMGCAKGFERKIKEKSLCALPFRKNFKAKKS